MDSDRYLRRMDFDTEPSVESDGIYSRANLEKVVSKKKEAASVKLHKDQYACKKSKHIIRVVSMLRQWILNLVFKIRHIPGVKNFADILTKALPLEPFAHSMIVASIRWLGDLVPRRSSHLLRRRREDDEHDDDRPSRWQRRIAPPG